MNVLELVLSCIACATTFMCKEQLHVDREILVQMQLQINPPAESHQDNPSSINTAFQGVLTIK